MADRNTVNLSERMKVTVCLNPVHSATGPLGVVLGYDLFAHMLNTNEDMMKMARMVAYDEGLPVVQILESFLHRHLWMNFLMTVFRMNIWEIQISSCS